MSDDQRAPRRQYSRLRAVSRSRCIIARCLRRTSPCRSYHPHRRSRSVASPRFRVVIWATDAPDQRLRGLNRLDLVGQKDLDFRYPGGTKISMLLPFETDAISCERCRDRPYHTYIDHDSEEFFTPLFRHTTDHDDNARVDLTGPHCLPQA